MNADFPIARGMPVWLATAIVGSKSLGVILAMVRGVDGLAALLFFAPDAIVLWGLFAPNSSVLCEVHTRFRPRGPQVWLTIDDGPDPEDTPGILAALARHGAKATFFLIGGRAAAHPELVAEIARGGHEIACHTHTHPAATFWAAGPRRTDREVADMVATVCGTGHDPRRFRAPVGIKNFFLARVLRRHRLRNIGWSIRSFDTVDAVTSRIVDRVVTRAVPGAIILMHEGPAVAPAVRVVAIERVLAGLAGRGLHAAVPDEDQLG